MLIWLIVVSAFGIGVVSEIGSPRPRTISLTHSMLVPFFSFGLIYANTLTILGGNRMWYLAVYIYFGLIVLGVGMQILSSFYSLSSVVESSTRRQVLKIGIPLVAILACLGITLCFARDSDMPPELSITNSLNKDSYFKRPPPAGELTPSGSGSV
jgi:hypothetical protein